MNNRRQGIYILYMYMAAQAKQLHTQTVTWFRVSLRVLEDKDEGRGSEADGGGKEEQE